MRKIVSMLLLAILGVSSLSFMANFANAGVQIEGTWVQMRGFMTQWGSNTVFGWIGAVAGMVNRSGTYHEWARAHAVWSYDKPRLNCTEPPIENFTFTCYGARLVNTTDVSLEGTLFTISGYWNVVRITTTVTVLTDETGHIIKVYWEYTVEKIVENATGELQVSLTPPEFELSITGIDTLSGIVKLLNIKYQEIEICDISGPNGVPDGKVDIVDLVRVAKRYRAVPGIWNYDHTIDVNFDNIIDIGDLTTIAANIKG
jgi:hypothetical protein